MKHPLLWILDDLSDDTTFVVAPILELTGLYAVSNILPSVGIAANSKSLVKKLLKIIPADG